MSPISPRTSVAVQRSGKHFGREICRELKERVPAAGPRTRPPRPRGQFALFHGRGAEASLELKTVCSDQLFQVSLESMFVCLMFLTKKGTRHFREDFLTSS